VLILGIGLFGLMLTISLLYGGDIGWGMVAMFWAVFVLGGLILSSVFGAPFLAFLFKAAVMITFAVKALSARSPSILQ